MGRALASAAFVAAAVALFMIVAREFTAPWAVGRELQRQEERIDGIRRDVDVNLRTGTDNAQAIKAHRALIEANSVRIGACEDAIKAHRALIEAGSARIDACEAALERTRSDVGALAEKARAVGRDLEQLDMLYRKVSKDNARLTDEMARLREDAEKLDGRLQRLEKRVGASPEGTEHIE